MCQRDAHLEFWYLQQPKSDEDGEKPPVVMPEGQHVLRVSLEGAREGRHLAASAMAPDGKHLAASDEAGTRLFRTNLEDLEVRVEKGLPAELRKAPSRQMLFCSPALLAAAPSKGHELLVLDVTQLVVVARFNEHRAAITCLAASGGGEWLASGDIAGTTHVYSLDALAHHAQVPVGRDQGFPTAMGFDSGRHRLLVVTSKHYVLVFDVESQTLAAEVPSPLRIPPRLVAPHVRACGIVAPPGTKDKLLLWGHSFMLKLDLIAAQKAEAEEDGPAKRRKLVDGAADEEGSPWKLYEDMEHIVALHALEESQWGGAVLPPQSGEGKKRKGGAAAKSMVLTLEVAPSALKKALPEAFERKKFNAMQR